MSDEWKKESDKWKKERIERAIEDASTPEGRARFRTRFRLARRYYGDLQHGCFAGRINNDLHSLFALSFYDNACNDEKPKSKTKKNSSERKSKK